jgi:hypothetical protein
MVHVVEDELIRSNAKRAFVCGYLLGLTWDAVNQLRAHDSDSAALLQDRLDELYPLVEEEFYGRIRPPEQSKPTEPTK